MFVVKLHDEMNKNILSIEKLEKNLRAFGSMLLFNYILTCILDRIRRHAGLAARRRRRKPVDQIFCSNKSVQAAWR
jgi:hypothetical protein